MVYVALVEPLAVAWHAVDAAQPKAGDDVLVFGAGPIGLAVIQCLRARGANNIVVAEVAAQRQESARRFGATHILDPRHDDVVARAREICSGRGPSFSIDCAGVPSSIKTACLATRAQGTIVNVAIWEKEVSFNVMDLVFGEKHYVGGTSASQQLTSTGNEILTLKQCSGTKSRITGALSKRWQMAA